MLRSIKAARYQTATRRQKPRLPPEIITRLFAHDRQPLFASCESERPMTSASNAMTSASNAMTNASNAVTGASNAVSRIALVAMILGAANAVALPKDSTVHQPTAANAPMTMLEDHLKQQAFAALERRR